MTIKVVLAQTEHEKRSPTHLYEGEEVWYRSIYFNNREEFEKKYNEIVGHMGGSSVLGIPDNYWKENTTIEPGIFFCIYYGKKEELPKCLILQHASVYVINQGGQTVDTIHC